MYWCGVSSLIYFNSLYEWTDTKLYIESDPSGLCSIIKITNIRLSKLEGGIVCWK